MTYEEFLARKFQEVAPVGFTCDVSEGYLFPHQRDLVRWALERGRAAIFASTGLGKSRMEIEWARRVSIEAGGPVLILAPLAVAAQTAREGEAIGVDVSLCRDSSDLVAGVNITNYDRLHRFDPDAFAGVVLDESSCIKHNDSRTFSTLCESFSDARFKLCATATPSPNDYAELGTHAEFLGVCSRAEMLAEFFVHDSGDTQTWRLKGHARAAFWRWVSSWGALVRLPSDLGYEDGSYILPPLNVMKHVVEVPGVEVKESMTLQERREARKASMPARILGCINLVMGESWTKSESANTTARTVSQTSKNSEPNAELGTPQTSNESEREQESINQPFQERRNGRPVEEIEQNTAIGGEPTCVIGTKENANISSLKTGSGEPSIQKLSEIGISEQSTESLSLNTTRCSLPSEACVPFAVTDAGSASPSITITQPGRYAVCCARRATWDSAGSKTTQQGSKPLRDTCGPRCEQWIVWCDYNAEQDAVADLLGDECVSIYGSLDPDEKERRYHLWRTGQARILVSKAAIFGWGVNAQFCAHMAFVGVNDSFESYYQAIRRIYRFGQSRPVEVHLFSSAAEAAVLTNLERKEREAEAMLAALSAETRAVVRENVRDRGRVKVLYNPRVSVAVPGWMRPLPSTVVVVDSD